MFDEVASLTDDVTTWTGHDTRPLILRSDDIRDSADRNQVLADIARDGITRYGDAQNFRRMGGA